MPFILEDGQIIGPLVYEPLTEVPSQVYGQGIGPGRVYDKLAANYLIFIKLASIRIWLGAYERHALGAPQYQPRIGLRCLNSVI